jgi:hypothetical protein
VHDDISWPDADRLRAELSPLGEHLMLRLVAAPLGPDGPRRPAASGRRRVIGVIGSETVGTERDLAGERANLEAVLDALPFLDGESGSSEWAVEDPELALQMIEMLPTLPAIAAVDWPKGKSVRVSTAGNSASASATNVTGSASAAACKSMKVWCCNSKRYSKPHAGKAVSSRWATGSMPR